MPKHASSLLLLFALLPGAYAGQTTQVEQTLKLQALTQLVDWFPKLVASFDKFVGSEEKKQFVRRLSTLSRDLMSLENRKLELDAVLSDASLTKHEALVSEVSDYYDELTFWLRKTQAHIEEISVSLQSIDPQDNKGPEVLNLLTQVLATRRSQRKAINAELEDGLTTINRIKAKNLEGLEVMRQARQAIGKLISTLKPRLADVT